MNLYNEKDYLKICRSKKTFLIGFVMDIILAVIIFILCLVFSSYETVNTFIAIMLPLEIICLLLLIFMIDMFHYYRILANEYLTILEGKVEKVVAKVTGFEGKITTLSDSSRVYLINVELNGKELCLYLSEIFENSFKIGEYYHLSLVYNYIKEFNQ